MAIGFGAALGRGAIQAARGIQRARPSSTLSALRAGDAELLQQAGRAAPTPPVSVSRPAPQPSSVPWTPAEDVAGAAAGTMEGTVFFTEARNAVALAKMTGDADVVEKVARRLVRDARWRRMGEDEIDIVLAQIDDAANSVGLTTRELASEVATQAARQAEDAIPSVAMRSQANRNSVENAIARATNEQQLTDAWEFTLRNTDLNDPAQRVWFNNLLIRIEQKTDELVKQGLLRELRTTPASRRDQVFGSPGPKTQLREGLEGEVFPPEVRAQMARILKVKPEDLQQQLISTEDIVEAFYNSRTARSFGSAALPPRSAPFDPTRYLLAIRSSFKPGEIESVGQEIGRRVRDGLVTQQQADALRPVFVIQRDAVAGGRFNQMIQHFEREASRGISDIKTDIRQIRTFIDDPDYVEQIERLRVRKGRGARRPTSDDAMPLPDGKPVTGGYSWSGPEGKRTLEQFLTESLGAQADERSRRAAQAIINDNNPLLDPYTKTRAFRFEDGKKVYLPNSVVRNMGPEAREGLGFERIPVGWKEAGLSEPYIVSRIRATAPGGPRAQNDRQIMDFVRQETGLTQQEYIDRFGYKILLQIKEAQTPGELKRLWTRAEVAKYQGVMDEGFFNILMNQYNEKLLSLRTFLAKGGKRGKPRPPRDRPTIADLYRESFTDMDEMLNYEGLARAVRAASQITVRS